MGLDMWAYSVSKDGYYGETDFKVNEDDQSESASWRKHNALHGWMEKLYREKGGVKESFNCTTLNLTLEDLTALEHDVKNSILPVTEGFFFGADSSHDEYNRDKTLDFINRARHDVLNGRKIYYTCWW